MTDPSAAQLAIADARMKGRWAKIAEGVIAIGTLAVVLTYGQLTFSKVTKVVNGQSAEIGALKAQQTANHNTGLQILALTKLLEQAAGPQAAAQSHQLILCVEAAINDNTDAAVGKPVPPLPEGCP